MQSLRPTTLFNFPGGGGDDGVSVDGGGARERERGGGGGGGGGVFPYFSEGTCRWIGFSFLRVVVSLAGYLFPGLSGKSS